MLESILLFLQEKNLSKNGYCNMNIIDGIVTIIAIAILGVLGGFLIVSLVTKCVSFFL